jgi:anti-sigma factor RsiW
VHPSDEELEQYAMRRLPAPRVRDFEIHLLVCWECQDRMAEMDAMVATLREACRRYIFRKPPSVRKHSFREALIGNMRISRLPPLANQG